MLKQSPAVLTASGLCLLSTLLLARHAFTLPGLGRTGIPFAFLRPGEQALVRFLLLLPVRALLAVFFRTVPGMPTYGSFAPVRLGLSFLTPGTVA